MKGLNEMEKFIYKKQAGVTALSASFTDFKYKNHAHKEYAIGVTMRGIQHYHLDGTLQLSHPGGVMLFNPEQAHDGMAHDEKGLDYVMLYIDPQSFLEVTGKKDIVHFSSPIVYDRTLKQQVIGLASGILNEKEEALCSELLVSLTDNLVQSSDSIEYKQDHVLISKAKDMLHSDLGSVLKLDEISRELQLSKFQFIRMFKSHTGITPYQYFLNCKIERAKQLMDAHQDVYDIIVACDFVDLSHLNKHFKKMYGITAFEYMLHVS